MYVPAFFTPLGNALLDRVKPSKSDRILDVACGTGILGRLIQGRLGAFNRLVGVDINPAMIGVAQKLGPAAEYQVGNATALDFGASEFDLVVCQHGLMFFPDRAKALAEMRRVVGAGGRTGISTCRCLRRSAAPDANTPMRRSICRFRWATTESSRR